MEELLNYAAAAANSTNGSAPSLPTVGRAFRRYAEMRREVLDATDVNLTPERARERSIILGTTDLGLLGKALPALLDYFDSDAAAKKFRAALVKITLDDAQRKEFIRQLGLALSDSIRGMIDDQDEAAGARPIPIVGDVAQAILLLGLRDGVGGELRAADVDVKKLAITKVAVLNQTLEFRGEKITITQALAVAWEKHRTITDILQPMDDLYSSGLEETHQQFRDYYHQQIRGRKAAQVKRLAQEIRTIIGAIYGAAGLPLPRPAY